MIDVSQALDILQNQSKNFGTESIPLAESIDRVLKEDWYTDRDLPPYDRVTMDGIGIAFQAYEAGKRAFPIEGTAAAGMPKQTLQNTDNCLEVMTGSILPKGIDTVIRYEDLDIKDGVAELIVPTVNFRQNVHFKGSDIEANTLIVPKNTRISAAEIGVGASIGKAKVVVAKLPKVMVISTGDELVQIHKQPLEHQIRRSNVYRLLTSLQSYKIQADSDHLNDDPDEIAAKLKTYLEDYDVIILSGGVSKGKFDYLPRILSELGVQKLFHKIKQRPGKPFWFGNYQDRCTILALPGNPVSSFVCMHRYFLTWLNYSQTGEYAKRPHAILTQDVHFKPDLTYFLEVQISYNEQGQILATPKKGNGSGDLANLTQADAFIELARGKNHYKAGEIYPIYGYR